MLFYIFIFLKLNFYDTWQKKKKKKKNTNLDCDVNI